jgi:hypothetical protein
MALVVAVGCALVGLVGSGEPARAQTVGAPCTTPDGQPGTFQQSTNPFTGVTTIVCSAGGGGPGGGGGRRGITPIPLIDGGYWRPDPIEAGFQPNYWIGWMARHEVLPGVTPPRFLGGPVEFRLFGSDASGAYTGVDVSGIRNSGYRVTDTAGAIPAGSLAPGFHSLDTTAGFSILADGTRLFDLNAAQVLLLGATFDYRRRDTDYGTSALTPGVVSAGSIRRNDYTLAGTVDYGIDTIYFSGRAAVNWSHADVTNAVLQSQGDTTGVGYQLSAAAGKIFPLFNSTGANPAMFVKAAPRSAGGHALFLDLNGGFGYFNMRDNGFTDSSGFIYGTEQLAYWTAGARANLVAAFPTGRATWLPYIGVTFDQQFSFRHTFDIPNQAAAVADTFNFDQGRTWWGVQGGLNVFDRGGVKVGLNAYYRASSDTSIVGGNFFLKVPLFADSVIPAKDSGIRVLSK